MASTTRPHDYYEILQVPQDADLQAIKLSWKRLVRVKHPDKNPAKDATAEFQLLEEAYSTLSDPDTRQIYDATYRAYKSTSSNRHSTRQTNREERPDRIQPFFPVNAMNELLEKLKMWKNRLRDEEQLLRDVRSRLKAVESETASLDMELVMMEQNKASGQTIWDLLDTFLPGGEDRQERQKEEQDRLYLDKIATMRIKETERTRRLEDIQFYETRIRAFRQQALSTEYDIRRMTEEMDLRNQEERVKFAEQIEREGWAYAHWSQTKIWAKGAPSPTDCKHGAWWSPVEGRFRCSCCAEDTQRFAFQCAGCKKITCASCRDELRRK